MNPSLLEDHAPLAELRQAAEAERNASATLIALLAEVDTRRLYLGEGYSSLFTYCTQTLHLSEHAAYGRITAARSARRFPTIFARLQSGDITLTTVSLLAPHLDDENHEALLDAARHMSKRDVEQLVAAMHPQPDIASSVRKLPTPPTVRTDVAREAMVSLLTDEVTPSVSAPAASAAALGDAILSRIVVDVVPRAPLARPVVAPLAPERFLLKVTIGRSAHDKLGRARDLLRHVIPSGDAAAIIERALHVLVEQLERSKIAATPRPRASRPTRLGSRHVPSSVKRDVWARDGGRCAFVGTDGRCSETGHLEFHHVVPFAVGGATSVENLELRCRAHNAYEGALVFGEPGSSQRLEAKSQKFRSSPRDSVRTE